MKDFKGLFTDTVYTKNPPGTWQNAKNILFTKKFNSPVNENGTKFSHLIEGELLGEINTNKDIIYFSKVYGKSYNSVISLYNFNTKEVVEVLKGNFNFNRPIEGVYKYDFEGSLIVAWCDGVFSDSNTPKIAKITNSDLPLDLGVLNDSNLELIELFPNVNKGTIEAKSDDGSIEGIVAYLTFKYGKGNEETPFKPLNTYAALLEISKNNSSLQSKGVKAILKDLDFEVYDYIKIGIYIIGKEKDTAFETKKIFIDSSEKSVNINTIIGLKSISLEDILLPKQSFSKIESMSLHKDSILALNVETKKPIKFQKYANLLKIIPRPVGLTRATNSPDVPFDNSDRVLMFNEVYSFNIQLEMVDGTVSDWFHIPNLDYTEEDIVNIWNTEYAEKHKLELNRFDKNKYYPKFWLINKGGLDNFGVWLNKDVYPDDDEYNSTVDYDGNPLLGQDLRGKPITFHRVMEEPRKNTALKIKESFAIGGAMISNFNIIPEKVRLKIKNIRLGIVKRNFGNSIILAEGLATPAAPQDKLHDYSYLNYSQNIGSQMSPIIPETQYRSDHRPGGAFNQFLFINPELEAFKPKISFNIINFKRLILRYTYGKDSLSAEITAYDSNPDRFILNKDINKEKEFDENKFYTGDFSYNYKLPNNPSQGSKFTDGGLYINNEKPLTNYLEEHDAFLPFKNNSENPIIDAEKLINYELNSFTSKPRYGIGAILNLMSFKDNLYNLAETEIIASKNTLTVVNGELPTYYDRSVLFKVGDVSFARISGGLHYVAVNNSEHTNYANAAIDVKVLSAFSSSYLNIKGAYDNYGDYLSPAIPEDLIALESKPYGYEVEGNAKNTSVNDKAAFPTFDIFKTYLHQFPYRIIRSSLTPDENFIINSLRTYYANNYFELKNGKGDGVAIRSNDNEVYIQMRYTLLYAKVKDYLKTQDADIFLQTRDIFENSPVSLTSKPEGYIGCEHKFSCIITKIGYITIDHKQGNVILAKPEVDILSYKGVRNQFMDLLEFEETFTEDVNGIIKAIDNPYRYTGFSIGIDERYNRLFISKIYPNKKILNTNNSFAESQTLVGYDEDKSFTFSFSLDANFWLCRHDFIVSKYVSFKKNLYGIKNIKENNKFSSISHLFNIGRKGEYFGKKYESYIDLVFNAQATDTKTYDYIDIITELEKNVKTQFTNAPKNKTLDKIIVFNDTQCSGEIDLNSNDYDIIRDIEGTWRVNNFRDLVVNTNLPILNDMGDINFNNLNLDKEWFEKSYFNSKFIVIRCIWSNVKEDTIYLNEVNVASRLSNR